MPVATIAKRKAAPRSGSPAPKARMTLAGTMRTLEKAGTAQARKTYARHGVTGPMFGVSFATLKDLAKSIGTDHDLALALWDTGNFDARNLAVKIVDPARMSSADLDRWAAGGLPRMAGGYAAMLAAETPYGAARLEAWLASKDEVLRGAGWTLLGQLAQRNEALPDAVFENRLDQIERTIHTVADNERYAMNNALIAIGLRSPALRTAALAAARAIGTVEVDHGDTACETPDARRHIEKAWAHSTSRGFPSPAAHERARAVPRRRC